MGDVILYKEDVERLNFLLKNLITDAKTLSALLITKDTRVLACQGTLASSDTTALAALLVGSFASTQAIAGLIGETEFDTMSHRGKIRNVIISLVDDNTILAFIFDNSTSAHRIAASMNKHLDILRKSLKTIGGNTTQDLFASGEPQTSSDDISFEKRTEDLFKGAETEPTAPFQPHYLRRNIPKNRNRFWSNIPFNSKLLRRQVKRKKLLFLPRIMKFILLMKRLIIHCIHRKKAPLLLPGQKLRCYMFQ